jgi:Flp pilus assembly protein TadD
MMTTKKRRRFHQNLVVVAVGTLLTACGPPGASELQQGEQDIKAGQFADAIVVLRDATRLLGGAPPPAQARAWNLLGLACQDAGQPEAASKAYQQALKLDRNNAASDYNLGCLRLQQTNYAGAIDYLTTYITLRPKDVQGYLRRGTACFHYALEPGNKEQRRFLESARHDFETAERISASAEAVNALGVLKLQSRSPGAEAVHVAATNFGLALTRNPHYAPALLNLATVSQQYLNNPRQALKLYSEYLTLSPLPPHYNEVTKLVHDLDLSLRISIRPEPSPAPAPAPNLAPRPAMPSVRANAAPSNPVAALPRPPPKETPPPQAVLSQPAPPPIPAPAIPSAPQPQPAPPPAPQPRPQQPAPPSAPQVSAPPSIAPAPLENAPKVNPSNEIPEPVVTDTNATPRKTITQRLNPMRWFSEKPKPREDGAASGAGAETEPPPVPPGARYEYPPPVTPIPGNRAQAKRLEAEATRARQTGDLTQSLRAYKDAIAADPTFFEASYGLGLAAIETRDYATALEELHRALALREDSAEARYAFAWTLQKRGYIEDAAHELGKLLEQHPDDVRAHLLLGNLYAEKLRQPKLAREQYLQALELDPRNPQAPNVRAWLLSN